MKPTVVVRCLAAAAAALLTSIASAQTTVTAADLISVGALGQDHATVGGMSFGAIGGSFASKTLLGVTAVGVSGGASGNEIDIGQALYVNFNRALNVARFDLAFLFDGPEYNDVNEVAKVFLLGTSLWGRLVATGPTSASWSFSDGSVSSLSPASVGGAGVWSVTNPFGVAEGTGLYFTAVRGAAGEGCGNCTNQSDYSLLGVSTASVSAVPEPSSYALMIGGLLAVGSVMRRRRAS